MIETQPYVHAIPNLNEKKAHIHIYVYVQTMNDQEHVFLVLSKKRTCIPRNVNRIAHAVATHSLGSGTELFFDEFSVRELPPSCLDCFFGDQVDAGL